LGNLLTPDSVGKLRAALHAKAKAEPETRFHALYDKLYRSDVLMHAYERCRSNKGAPGVDGQTFADVEAYGVQKWLGELAQKLRKETYEPKPIRRVNIPKPGGKLRPLGISCLDDRVCMMAAVLILEPIFEADLPPEQYGYRSGISAHDALESVTQGLRDGYVEVVDADLASYFDTIPHSPLLRSVARRVVDRRMLSLIKRWLDCAVEENGWARAYDPHAGEPGHGPRDSSGLATESLVGEPLHAALHLGVAAMGGQPAPWGQAGDLRRRPGDPLQAGHGRQRAGLPARADDQAWS